MINKCVFIMLIWFDNEYIYIGITCTYVHVFLLIDLCTYRAGLRELEALGEVNLVAPNEIKNKNEKI